jgi:Fur family iron response transcriptional regulator
MSKHRINKLSRPEIRKLLDRAGIMPTQQRLQIAHALLNRSQHLSADQLLVLVNQEDRRVSKATVYNTLSLFVRKGLVREVLVDPNRIFYDSNTDHHYHLYNEDTGTLTDTYLDGLPSDISSTLPENTTLVEVDVIIRVRNT